MKKVKTLKICIAVVLIVVLLGLLGATITLSVMKKDYNLNLKNPDVIRIYTAEYTTPFYFNYKQGTEEYDKIMELFNKGYTESLLNLILNGQNKTENYIEAKNAQSNLINNVVTTNSGYFYIEFNYYTKNNLMLNDEEYLKSNGDVVTYTKLLIEIKSANEFNSTTIYVENAQTSTSSSATTDPAISSSYQIMTYMNNYELYTYLKEIVK